MNLSVVQGVHCDFLIYFGLAVVVARRVREREIQREKHTNSKDLCARRDNTRKTVMMSNELCPKRDKNRDRNKEAVSDKEQHRKKAGCPKCKDFTGTKRD